jgi:hypothetical protein
MNITRSDVETLHKVTDLLRKAASISYLLPLTLVDGLANRLVGVHHASA